MRRLTTSTTGLFLSLGLAACVAPASDKEDVAFFNVSHPVPGRYIVVLEDGPVASSSVDSVAQALVTDHGTNVQVDRQYNHALRGFAASMDEATAIRMATDARVRFVEEDGFVQANDTQTGATWGIDRIDQNLLPLDGSYTYNTRGSGVTAYVIDTGIRVSHTEFGGRAQHAFDAIGDGQNAEDCNGHGTHVSGTIGSATYGVAKNVELRAVRVLDCGGSGTNAGVIQGIDWVTANAVHPAVANMSLGGGVSDAVDTAVRNSVNSGVIYAVAAGNDNADACTHSPARTPEAITVGATTITDQRASFSNWGTCVDIFAPGQDITSTWLTNDTATNTISGTSMATPHVAGTVALYLEAHPNATPSEVVASFTGNGTAGVVQNPGSGSPNVLLYSGFIGGGGGDTTPPAVSITSPANGSTVQGQVTINADASDNVGVRRLALIVDGAQLATDDTAPYSFTWNSDNASNGPHGIDVRAFDLAGNTAVAHIDVTISRAGGAAFDPALHVPACRTPGSVCDTDTLVRGRGTLGPELNTPNTLDACIDGSSGTYLSDESVERIRVTTGGSALLAPGANVTVEVTVFAWSTGSADTLDIFHAPDANSPTWTLVQSIVPPAGGNQVLSSSFTLPAGSLQAFRAQFRYQGTAVACSNGSFDDHDDLVFSAGGPPPDTTPPTVSITSPANNASLSAPFNVTVDAADNVGVTSVELFIDNVSAGVATAAPYAFNNVGTGLAAGAHALEARARDAAGNMTTSARVDFSIADTSIAIYDPMLGAPSCSTQTAVCDSGTLLNGRGSLGPEANAPNTLDTCTDGNSGTYLSSESLERIRVSSADGMPIRAGATVNLEVTVFAYSTGSNNRLDLYQAGDATHPQWTFIRTLSPGGGGSRTLTTSFTLSSSGTNLRGIRGRFRYRGSQRPCQAGSFDDHDDVAIRLAP